jgi:hypothetical protein
MKSRKHKKWFKLVRSHPSLLIKRVKRAALIHHLASKLKRKSRILQILRKKSLQKGHPMGKLLKRGLRLRRKRR